MKIKDALAAYLLAFGAKQLWNAPWMDNPDEKAFCIELARQLHGRSRPYPNNGMQDIAASKVIIALRKAHDPVRYAREY